MVGRRSGAPAARRAARQRRPAGETEPPLWKHGASSHTCGPSSVLAARPRSSDLRSEDSSSESGSGNGLPALTPPSSAVTDGSVVREAEVVNGNSGPAPLDFSTPSSSSSCEDQQPMNLSEPPPQRLPFSATHLPVTVSAAAAALLGALHPRAPEELRRKYPLAAKPPLAPHHCLPLPHTQTHNAHTPNTHSHVHGAELRLDRDGRDYGGKSPQYSSAVTYDNVKIDLSAEDLSVGRHSNQVAPDDDDDDHDDHDDSDKINDVEGVDPERLKAFNVSPAEPLGGSRLPRSEIRENSEFSVRPADVCAPVCGREPGSDGSHLQTAQGEDPSHHRILQQTVPRVPGACPQAHPHLPQILPTHEEERHGDPSDSPSPHLRHGREHPGCRLRERISQRRKEDAPGSVPRRADRSGQALQRRRRPEGALLPRSLRLLPGVSGLPLPGRHALHQRSWNQLHLPWLPRAGRHHAAPGVPDRGNLRTEQRPHGPQHEISLLCQLEQLRSLHLHHEPVPARWTDRPDQRVVPRLWCAERRCGNFGRWSSDRRTSGPEDSSSESGSGNGLPALTPPSSAVTDGSVVREAEVVNGNSGPAPLDFSTPSSSSSCEDQQPMNLSEPPPQRLPFSATHLPVTVSAAAAALLGALHPRAPEEVRRKYPLAAKPPLAPHHCLPLPHTQTHNAHTPNTHSHVHGADCAWTGTAGTMGARASKMGGATWLLTLCPSVRLQSPQYSSAVTYDNVKIDLSAEDLSVGRHSNQVAPDDDDDDHDDHDDSDKINDVEGVDPERLKAFNVSTAETARRLSAPPLRDQRELPSFLSVLQMFVRLFVDENLDRMVPISKQPKEKIQAIIESCSRQFPEFQERARKRIRTYLKSCRRMKKNGMETRPTPPHLTSAMAENIPGCRLRERISQRRKEDAPGSDEQIALDKPSSGGGALREPSSLAHSAYSLASAAFPSQDATLYINGAGISYTYRGYPGLGATMQHPVSLTGGTSAQSNGRTQNQLSQPEVTAVRQLIAGYRESAAFAAALC
ncbi:unnamed protein product [Tetraodon nigroviridis]|uniref:(spotted green pufferfish) hypothetical protein n=2 Tax=Percomorphaceae TaxID=1489872 RepID=Q4TEC3_TETNG|nr:unnamed protein product [Tetraodon nigroviridis]